MWTTIAFLTAMTVVPGQANEFALTNVRSTYGIHGPTRSDNKLLPGDNLVVSFEIEGAQGGGDGKVNCRIGLEVADDKGKVHFKQAPRPMAGSHPNAGKALPAVASVQIGLDQPPGAYTVKVTVLDLVANASREATFPFQVVPRAFGLVRLRMSANSQASIPATPLVKGKSFWIDFALVGFARAKDKKQPHLSAALRVLDEQGRSVLTKPPAGEVAQDVPARVQEAAMQFVVRLQHAGKYTIELTAADKVADQQSTIKLPITIEESGPQPKPQQQADARPVIDRRRQPIGPRVAGTNGQAPAIGITEKGTLFRRGAAQKTWDVLAQKGALETGDVIVGAPGAVLESANGAVRLTAHSDIDGLSPFPVIESGIRLGAKAMVDLDFTLDRGRVEIANHKETGAAQVKVHIRHATCDITLSQPGTTVALELYGRWAPGVPFTLKPGPHDAPAASLVLLVLQGEAVLKHAGSEYAMSAPPGPALMEWDSVHGLDDAPRHLEKLPSWATQGSEDSAQVKGQRARMQRLRQALATGSIDAATTEYLDSDNPEDRRTAVFLLAALDDLDRLTKVMREMKHADILENGVIALRNWIGRGPGQDILLYDALIESAKLSPVQAATVLTFLHSPGPAQLARPEIYQALAAYLNHDEALIRGLAYWHLYRLLPAGRDFGYNPLDGKEQRQAAVQKWRTLVAKVPLPAQKPPRERKP